MPNEEVSIEVKAKVEAFKKEMSKLPGITQDEVEKAARAMHKEWGNAQKKSEQAAKDVAKQWKDNLNKVSSAAANLGEKLGGPFARIASLANGALKPVAELGGGLAGVATAGLAIGGTALAVAATTAAVVTLTNAAVAAEERLVAAGKAAEIPSESRTALAEYTASTEVLKTNVDLVTVAIGAELAPALTRVITVINEATEAVGGADGLSAAFDRTSTSLRISAALFTVGGSEVFRWATGPVTEAIDASAKLTAQLSEQEKAMLAVEKATVFTGPLPSQGGRDFAAEERERAEAVRDSAAAAREAERAWADFESQLVADIKLKQDWVKANNEAHAAQVTQNLAWKEGQRELQLIGREAQFASDQIALIISEEAAQQQTDQFASIRDAVLGLADSIATSVGDIFSFMGDAVADQLADIEARQDRLTQRNIDAQEKISEIRKEAFESERKGLTEAEQARIADYEAEIDRNKGRLEHLKQEEDAKRQAARRAFIANKAATVIGILLQTGLGVMNAMATVPWPAAPFVAAGVGVMGGTQATLAAARPAPEFPTGRLPSPDHDLVGVQPDEAILNAPAARDLGEDRIRELNEGRRGGGAELLAVVQIGRREIASARGRERVRVDERAGKTTRRGRR